jgi:hypothetical protein
MQGNAAQRQYNSNRQQQCAEPLRRHGQPHRREFIPKQVDLFQMWD